MIMNCDAFILPKKVAEISQRVYCKKYTYYIINMSCTLRTVEGTPLESTFPGKYQVQKTGAADALAGSQQATTPGNGAAGAPISPPCCSSSKASFLPLLLPHPRVPFSLSSPDTQPLGSEGALFHPTHPMGATLPCFTGCLSALLCFFQP